MAVDSFGFLPASLPVSSAYGFLALVGKHLNVWQLLLEALSKTKLIQFPYMLDWISQWQRMMHHDLLLQVVLSSVEGYFCSPHPGTFEGVLPLPELQLIRGHGLNS
jgi:hypothetical protein